MRASDALRRAKADVDMTADQVARAAGMSRQMVSNTLGEGRDLRSSTVARMCAAMGCDLEVVTPLGTSYRIGDGDDNPLAVRLDAETAAYFAQEARAVGVTAGQLAAFYLFTCAREGRRLDFTA